MAKKTGTYDAKSYVGKDVVEQAKTKHVKPSEGAVAKSFKKQKEIVAK